MPPNRTSNIDQRNKSESPKARVKRTITQRVKDKFRRNKDKKKSKKKDKKRDKSKDSLGGQEGFDEEIKQEETLLVGSADNNMLANE